MHPRDSLNHLLVISIVGAAWLLGRIDSTIAVPVLLALAGLITIPASLAARGRGNGDPPIPPGLVIPLAFGILPALTRMIQAVSLLAVLIGVVL